MNCFLNITFPHKQQHYPLWKLPGLCHGQRKGDAVQKIKNSVSKDKIIRKPEKFFPIQHDLQQRELARAVSAFSTHKGRTHKQHLDSAYERKRRKKKIFSSCNCSILSAFQFPSEVPSVGTDFLGAVTQSSNTEALSLKSFKSFPKFHSYCDF